MLSVQSKHHCAVQNMIVHHKCKLAFFFGLYKSQFKCSNHQGRLSLFTKQNTQRIAIQCSAKTKGKHFKLKLNIEIATTWPTTQESSKLFNMQSMSLQWTRISFITHLRQANFALMQLMQYFLTTCYILHFHWHHILRLWFTNFIIIPFKKISSILSNMYNGNFVCIKIYSIFLWLRTGT